MRTKLSGVVKSLGESDLLNVFRLLGVDPRCWSWLSEAERISLKQIAQTSLGGKKQQIIIFQAVVVEELKPIIIQGLIKLPANLQIKIISSVPRPQFSAQAIALYSEAGSYRGAESLGEELILPMASHFSAMDVQKILETVQGIYVHSVPAALTGLTRA